MMLDNGVEIANYEVGYIQNSHKHTVAFTDDLEKAKDVYKELVQKYATNDTTHHIIIYLFDVNKQSNIDYYNNYNEMV